MKFIQNWSSLEKCLPNENSSRTLFLNNVSAVSNQKTLKIVPSIFWQDVNTELETLVQDNDQNYEHYSEQATKHLSISWLTRWDLPLQNSLYEVQSKKLAYLLWINVNTLRTMMVSSLTPSYPSHCTRVRAGVILLGGSGTHPQCGNSRSARKGSRYWRKGWIELRSPQGGWDGHRSHPCVVNAKCHSHC